MYIFLYAIVHATLARVCVCALDEHVHPCVHMTVRMIHVHVCKSFFAGANTYGPMSVHILKIKRSICWHVCMSGVSNWCYGTKNSAGT